MTGKEKKRKKIEESKEELFDMLLRTQANFENYRKQTENRIIENKEIVARELITKIIPVIDNFELALMNAKSENKEFLQGIELIYAQLNKILEEVGVKKINTKNKKFDPYYHEALMKVPSEQKEEMIIEVFQKGYTLRDKVIRHAKVKISAGNKDNSINNSNNNNEKNKSKKETEKDNEKCPECAKEKCSCGTI